MSVMITAITKRQQFQTCYKTAQKMQKCKAPDCQNEFEYISIGRGFSRRLYCSQQCRNRHVSQQRFMSDPQKVRQTNLDSYRKHKDRILAERREKYWNNREKGTTKTKQKANPERSVFRTRRYQLTKKTSTDRPITWKQWQSILKACRGKCFYCGIDSDNLTQDHIVPISKGGPDSEENIVAACITCNKRKSNLDVGDFLVRLRHPGLA